MSKLEQPLQDINGFSGLQMLVSDIANDLDVARKIVSTVSSKSSIDADRTAPPSRRPLTQLTQRSALLIGAGIIIGTIIFAKTATLNVNKNSETPVSIQESRQINTTTTEDTSTGNSLTSIDAKPTRPAKETPTTKTSSYTGNAIPPAGTNHLHSWEEIHYCLVQQTRIKAIESIINTRRQNEVDRYNNLVDDYNSRCGSFRYASGTLESVRNALAPTLPGIAESTKSEWVRNSLELQ